MLTSIKKLLPLSMLNFARRVRADWLYRGYKKMSRQEIFQHIYKDNVWGKSTQANAFFSGTGSHDKGIVVPYVLAVQTWLSSLPCQLDAVDIGCGDFFVGSKIRGHCARFVACDIVQELIDSHRKTYQTLNVDFRCLDLCADDMPQGDVMFVRQVLQHLDNQGIAEFCKKITGQYQYIVITEHLPRNTQFVANRDKPAGPDTRIGYNSGVILTRKPFFLNVKSEMVLCEVPENGGVVQTLLYQLL